MPFDQFRGHFYSNLLQNSGYDDITVLDFFAGSGSTGHAVLSQNQKDGGTRSFILCTNNENGICEEVTYPRLKTVITGRRIDGSDYSDGLPGSLKYMRVGYVPISEDDYYGMAEELLKHVKTLVELENGIDFDRDLSIAIVLTDDEYDKLMQETDFEELESVYLGHDVFQIEEYARELARNNVEIKVIPQYYYPEAGI